MLKVLFSVFMFVGITFAQVYIPTGVSTQSGILRNVPTSVVRVPANTYITDGNRAYLTAQVSPFQWVNTRLNNDNKNRFSNDREDNFRRILAADREERLNELLRFVEQRDNENRRFQSNEDRYFNDREDRQREDTIRDLWRLRDDSGNSRQSHELNRNQLRALLNRENNNNNNNNNDENRNHDNNDRNRNNDRNNDRNVDRNNDRNNDRNERLRDLSDVLSRTSGRN